MLHKRWYHALMKSLVAASKKSLFLTLQLSPNLQLPKMFKAHFSFHFGTPCGWSCLSYLTLMTKSHTAYLAQSYALLTLNICFGNISKKPFFLSLLPSQWLQALKTAHGLSFLYLGHEATSLLISVYFYSC